MVYKKYIKRRGKVFGPYYCESYRDKNGKVKTRFVSGPKKKDRIVKKIKKKTDFLNEINKKKVLLIFGVFFLIFLVFLAGNLNYSFKTGKAVQEIQEDVDPEISSFDKEVLEKISKNELTSNVNIEEHVDLNIKNKIFEKNKIMEFELPEGSLELSFDLMNYSEWEEKEAETEIDAENFDIGVEESSEKYKWGYDIKLKDLNFMAKIDVSSDKNIKVIDNQTLKIRNNYLSFSDLSEQGYILNINQPVFLDDFVNVTDINVSEINITDVTSNLTDVENMSMGNITQINETEINISEFNETAVINESIIDIEDNESIEEASVDGITEDESDVVEEIEVIEDESEEIIEESEQNIDSENVEQLIEEEIIEETEESEEIIEETITGQVIKGINGFFINGFKGLEDLTGFAVKEKHIVSIYIQRNFNETNYSIGDIINLDPFLIILISKAEHLDENREFISDIYDDVKEKDDNWSEVISNDEYVRVTFEQNLTNENDITIYARATNESSEIEVYRKDDNDLVAKFENVSAEDWYKVYLTSLNQGESHDVFDLKILGNVEFDYIVDPGTAIDGTTAYQCGTITTPGTYTMNQSITNNTLTEPCINITTQNITLDCAGYYISSDDNQAGIYSNQINTTIMGCNVSMRGGIGSYGIYLVSANNSYIYNNTLNGQEIGLDIIKVYNSSFDKITASETITITSYGIYINGGENNTFSNIVANSNTGSESDGIISYSENNFYINITANSNANFGINLDGPNGDYNTLENITANSNGWAGIEVKTRHNSITNLVANSNDKNGIYHIVSNNVGNNTFTNITLNSNKQTAFYLKGANNLIENLSIWNCSTGGSFVNGETCLHVDLGINNTFINGDFNLSASDLIYISHSNNTKFSDIELYQAGALDVNMSGSSLNNTFLNVTYNVSKVSIESGSELIRKWYYQAYVNDTNSGDVPNANLSFYNVTGVYNLNLSTNSSGWTQIGEIIDYVNTGGTKSYYSNYTIYATNGSAIINHTYNVTLNENNLNEVFTLDNFPPVITLISLPSLASTTIDYMYNVTDYSSVMNCSLILDGAVVSTNTSINNTGENESITYTTAAGTHTYSINCTDLFLNTGSSSERDIVVVSTTTTVTTGGGGGGGGTRTISLNIEVPSSIIIEEQGIIDIPIVLNNNGQIRLNDISLTGYVLKNREISDVNLEFDRDSFNALQSGDKEDVNVVIEIDSSEIAVYEAVINATSGNPSYETSSVIYLNFVGKDATGVKKMVVFSQDMIVENPECLELKEMVEDARKSFEQGDFQDAIEKSNIAVEACRNSISGPKSLIFPSPKGQQNILIYLGIGIALAVVLGIIVNIYKRIRFREKKKIKKS